jgi:hypothetical protein
MGLGERMQDIDGRVLTPEESEALRLRQDARELLQAIREGEEEDAAEREKGASGSGARRVDP